METKTCEFFVKTDVFEKKIKYFPNRLESERSSVPIIKKANKKKNKFTSGMFVPSDGIKKKKLKRADARPRETARRSSVIRLWGRKRMGEEERQTDTLTNSSPACKYTPGTKLRTPDVDLPPNGRRGILKPCFFSDPPVCCY